MARQGEMGSSRRLSHSPAVERPVSHFVKVILPYILEDKRLRIPQKFVKKFGEKLSDVAKVVVSTGNGWEIGLTKAENNIWFVDGWQKFVEHHSIGCGYLLVFKYKGFSDFSVCIFDMSACEIQYPINGPASNSEEINSVEKCSVHNEKEILVSTVSSPPVASKSGVCNRSANKGESSRRRTCSAEKNLVLDKLRKSGADQEIPNFQHLNDKRSKKLNEGNIGMKFDDDAYASKMGKSFNDLKMSSQHGSLFNQTKADKSKSKTEFDENELVPKFEQMEIDHNGFVEASEASKTAICAAKMYKPEHPSFMTVLREYNIHRGYLNVPTAFAGKYFRGVSNCKLQVSDEREWPIRIISRGPKLSKGWIAFCKENGLKEGDICVFEQIEGTKIVLKVTIFCADEDGGSLD